MHRLGSLSSLLLFAACTHGAGQATCPTGEACTDATQVWLTFGGADDYFARDIAVDRVPATAVGGTQLVRIQYAPDHDNRLVDLDLPFEATMVGGGAVIDRVDGATVLVHGVAPGTGELRISDPQGEPYGATSILTGIPSQVSVFTSGEQATWPPSDPGPAVFAAGDVPLIFAVGTGTGPIDLEAQLVDTSMQLAGPATASQISWNVLDIAQAAVGTHTVTLGIGGATAFTVPIRIVASADALVLIGGPAQSVHAPRELCFVASSAGEPVRGLTWTFAVDGGTASTQSTHDACPVIASDGGATVTVHATAGGLTTDVTLPST